MPVVKFYKKVEIYGEILSTLKRLPVNSNYFKKHYSPLKQVFTRISLIFQHE